MRLFYDKEAAQKAYDAAPNSINDYLSDDNFTDKDELRTYDHRTAFHLRRIADALEEANRLNKSNRVVLKGQDLANRLNKIK